MIVSNGGANQSAGIGFAIPINTAKAVINDLVTLGRVRRPALGMRTIPIDSNSREQMGLEADYGLLIVSVQPEAPPTAPDFAAATRKLPGKYSHPPRRRSHRRH